MGTNKVPQREIGRPRTYTDDDIFAATARAVARLGYARLTIDAVAAEVGCTGPALIGRFGSKLGLIRAYLEWANAVSRERFRRERELHTSPLAALRARVGIPPDERLDEIGDANGNANIVVFHLSAWAEPELRASEQGRRQMFEDEIVALLQAARDAGELIDCDFRRLGRTLVAALTGTSLQWASDHQHAIEARMVEVLEDVIRPYLAAPPAAPTVSTSR
jgi:AcrR family transcriptional regulator